MMSNAIQTPARPAPAPARVACFGEILLRLSSSPGEKLLQSPALHATFGGAEANVACALARFGHDVAMVSALPSNALGLQCAAQLRSFGVATDHILWSPGRMGLYYLEPGAPGRPANILYDRAGSVFALHDFALNWRKICAQRRWLHVSGISMAVGAGSKRAALEAVAAARADGSRISVDCNHRPSLWLGRSAEAAHCQRELIGGATVLFANDQDLSLATESAPRGETAEERFTWAYERARAMAQHLSVMATTHRSVDEAGNEQLRAFACDSSGAYFVGAIRLGQAVDRIGSGDAFAAAFLHRYMADADTRRALEFGLAAAVYKRSVKGDILLASVEEIEAAVRSPSDVQR